MDGQDPEFTHRQNATMLAILCKTAPRRRIPSYCEFATHRELGWTSPYHFGINLGPVVLMCENYRSELPWRLMRACPYIVTGLRHAEFRKGWL